MPAFEDSKESSSCAELLTIISESNCSDILSNTMFRFCSHSSTVKLKIFSIFDFRSILLSNSKVFDFDEKISSSFIS